MTNSKRTTAEWDQAIADRPPRIRWAGNGKGIQVFIDIDDPHTEKPYRRDWDRPLPPEHFDGCTCRVGPNVQLIRDPYCAQHYTRETHR